MTLPSANAVGKAVVMTLVAIAIIKLVKPAVTPVLPQGVVDLLPN